MTDISVPTANAVLGQTRGFLDALLGPKIERIKKWAREQDIIAEINSTKLELVLNRYLTRLLISASSMRSIVFPQHKLNLEDVYEPTFLKRLDLFRDSITYSANDIINSDTHTTIVDAAGMGKSTFVKHIALSIYQKSDTIPIIYNLRQYDNDEDIVISLCRELDDFEYHFSKEVFIKLILRGKFFIILDAFDEVDNSIQKAVGLAIEELSLKCGFSRILLTSRPQNYVPSLKSGDLYEFAKLTPKQAASMVRRYDKIANLTFGEKLIDQFYLVPNELLGNPLLVALLYRTFAVNGRIEGRITNFFDDTYKALFEGHDLTKPGFTRTRESCLSVDDFRKLLQAHSYYSVIKQQFSWIGEDYVISTIEESCELCQQDAAQSRFIFNDLLCAVPLLIRDGNEIRYIHKTIQEFFAAGFIKNLEKKVDIAKKLKSSPLANSLKVIFEYIYEMDRQLGRKAFTLPAANHVLSKGFLGTLTAEQTIRTVGTWYGAWSNDHNAKLFGDQEGMWVTAKFSKTEKKIIIGLCLQLEPAFKFMPISAWNEITAEVGVPYPDFDKLYSILSQFKKGIVVPITGSLFEEFLKEPSFVQFAIEVFAVEVTGETKQTFTIDATACRAILDVNKRETKALRAANNLLKPVRNKRRSLT